MSEHNVKRLPLKGEAVRIDTRNLVEPIPVVFLQQPQILLTEIAPDKKRRLSRKISETDARPTSDFQSSSAPNQSIGKTVTAQYHFQ